MIWYWTVKRLRSSSVKNQKLNIQFTIQADRQSMILFIRLAFWQALTEAWLILIELDCSSLLCSVRMSILTIFQKLCCYEREIYFMVQKLSFLLPSSLRYGILCDVCKRRPWPSSFIVLPGWRRERFNFNWNDPRKLMRLNMLISINVIKSERE